MDSPGVSGQELSHWDTQEEEEIGTVKEWLSRWEARGPVGRGCQTSQGNGCLTASDSASPGQHSAHRLIYLEKKKKRKALHFTDLQGNENDLT